MKKSRRDFLKLSGSTFAAGTLGFNVVASTDSKYLSLIHIQMCIRDSTWNDALNSSELLTPPDEAYNWDLDWKAKEIAKPGFTKFI